MGDDDVADDSTHGENEETGPVQPHPSVPVRMVNEEAQDLPGPHPLSDEAVHGEQESEDLSSPHPLSDSHRIPRKQDHKVSGEAVHAEHEQRFQDLSGPHPPSDSQGLLRKDVNVLDDGVHGEHEESQDLPYPNPPLGSQGLPRKKGGDVPGETVHGEQEQEPQD